jgi:hypothetical protein
MFHLSNRKFPRESNLIRPGSLFHFAANQKKKFMVAKKTEAFDSNENACMY